MFHVPSCMYKDWRTLLSFKFSMQPNVHIEEVLFKQLFVCIIDLPRTRLYASWVRSTLLYVWRILQTLFCMHEECIRHPFVFMKNASGTLLHAWRMHQAPFCMYEECFRHSFVCMKNASDTFSYVWRMHQFRFMHELFEATLCLHQIFRVHLHVFFCSYFSCVWVFHVTSRTCERRFRHFCCNWEVSMAQNIVDNQNEKIKNKINNNLMS